MTQPNESTSNGAKSLILHLKGIPLDARPQRTTMADFPSSSREIISLDEEEVLFLRCVILLWNLEICAQQRPRNKGRPPLTMSKRHRTTKLHRSTSPTMLYVSVLHRKGKGQLSSGSRIMNCDSTILNDFKFSDQTDSVTDLSQLIAGGGDLIISNAGWSAYLLL